jgi:hypothetical protein
MAQGGPLVSPLREYKAPEPRHPGQATMFTSEVDTTFAVDAEGAAIHVIARLRKVPRQRCTACGKRRVLFFLSFGGVINSAPMCARCTGIR